MNNEQLEKSDCAGAGRVFRFSSVLYNPNAVMEAVKAFSEAADFHVSRTKTSVSVRIAAKPGLNPREITGEFCNYVLVQNRFV